MSRFCKLGSPIEAFCAMKNKHFSLWTTTTVTTRSCAIQIARDGAPPRVVPLEDQGEGNYGADIEDVAHGDRYVFLLDGEPARDPYAEFLPDGVDVDALATVWRSSYVWKHPFPPRSARASSEAAAPVIYELHIGTFTPEGTYASATAKLAMLAELGFTAIELLPIAAFPGSRGWGYDGVAHFAPFAPYGNPDELRAFIDSAHGLGLMVFLDVVYNHFGPAGNVLYKYSSDYFSKLETGWGDAPNFAHQSMRSYVEKNVRYWLEEFRFDGLRLDATHAIVDETSSMMHILQKIAEQTAAALSPKRFLFAEDERNDPKLVREYGFDGIWADDLHHQVHVALTGERDGYYKAFLGSAHDLADTINHGWFYRGAVSPATNAPRGKDAGMLAAEAFVYCIQNHDQIGNRAFGDRLKNTDAFEAATVLLLFLPMTAMFFMGQEWGATTPFQFFTDHDAELGRQVTEGRRKEFARFDVFSDDTQRDKIPDPQAATTFEASKLDWSSRGATPDSKRILETCRFMLQERKTNPILRSSRREHLSARADGQNLIVTRTNANEALVLYVCLTGECTEPRDAHTLRSGANYVLKRVSPR